MSWRTNYVLERLALYGFALLALLVAVECGA